MISRTSRILSALVVVGLIAFGVWWLRPSNPKTTAHPIHPTSGEPSNNTPAGASTPSIAPTSVTITPESPAAPVAATPTPTIDSILADPALDILGSARALAALVQNPALSIETRSEALAHLLNLSVEHETELLLPLLKSARLPDSLASTILTEALNRPLDWQADACLAVMARTTGQELHTQARDHLAFLTSEDHGEDLKAWALAIRNARAKWASPDS
ncbi:MAG: hypothetical protein K0R17_1978 [Rariglobus sp.]|jgi:hypothetical protein|nr:hypothetical protein [Rariglobus sp.]